MDDEQDKAKPFEEYRITAERELENRVEQFLDALASDETAATVTEAYKDMRDDTVPADMRRAFSSATTGNNSVRKPAAGGVHSGHRRRLRESANRDKRLDGFSDVELLEMLLTFAVPQKDVNVLAHRLLDEFGSIDGVMDAPSERLAGVSCMTKNGVVMLRTLKNIGCWRGWREIRLECQAHVAEFFRALLETDGAGGTYIAYLDGEYRLLTLERADEAALVPMRAVIGSATKYAARSVILVRRIDGTFPEAFGLSDDVARLSKALALIGVRLLDFIMFTDYGYYTLGEPPSESGGWYVQYLFVPSRGYATADTALTGASVKSGGGGLLALDEIGRWIEKRGN